MFHRKMVVISDLTPEESIKVELFLKNSIDDGDLDLPLQDCISILPEIKFHSFVQQNYPNGLNQNCKTCSKNKSDSIHQEIN